MVEVAVSALHGDIVAVVVPCPEIGGGEQIAGGVPLAGVLALANEAVAHGGVPVVAKSVIDGAGAVDVLVILFAVVGEAVEGVAAVAAGQSCSGVAGAGGDADLGFGRQAIAEVRYSGAVVILVVGDGVLGIEAGGAEVVVELAHHAGELRLVAIGFEAARIALVEKGWKRSAAARCGERDDAGGGVGSIEHGVGPAIDLDVLEAEGRDIAEVEAAADVLDGDAIHDDAVGGGSAAADEDRGDAAALTLLHDVEAGNLAERVGHVGAVHEVFDAEAGDGGADLRLGLRGSGGGDDDRLADGLGLEDDVLLDVIEAAAVEALRLQLAERNAGGEHIEAAGAGADHGVAAVGASTRAEQHVAVLHQADGGVGDGVAQRVSNGAVDANRVQGRRGGAQERKSGKAKSNDGEETAQGPRAKSHGLLRSPAGTR